MDNAENKIDVKSRPYKPEDFDIVGNYIYDKFHCTRYTIEQVIVRKGEIFFKVDGKEYNSQELYDNFDECYSVYTFGDEKYYLPAGAREQDDLNEQIKVKADSIKKVCPFCKSTDIHHSEEPSALDFSSITSKPSGLYIWCKSCNFALNHPQLPDTDEKIEIFSRFVDQWNSIEIKDGYVCK